LGPVRRFFTRRCDFAALAAAELGPENRCENAERRKKRAMA